MQTGYKEAKLLEEENEKTSVMQVENDDASSESDLNTDVDLESARKRMEEALKNIPHEKFDDVDEQKWKEISKNHRSYEELKEDLKELELGMKTEAELVKEMIEQYLKITKHDEPSNADRLTILEDLSYLSHSIDNSLLFVSLGGLESIIMPLLNQTKEELVTKALKMLGVIVQNNAVAQAYVTEKTNIGNYLINILSTSINSNQLSAALFAYGSLMRNNRKVPADLSKTGFSLLIGVIVSDKSEISLSHKTKALVLMDDLVYGSESKDQDFIKLLDELKFCKHLESFVSSNVNGLIADVDSAEKVINSLARLKHSCHVWSESPKFRHAVLVLLSHSKSQLELDDEDLKFIYTENASLLEEIHEFLYADLRISKDDLSEKYESKIKDEL